MTSAGVCEGKSNEAVLCGGCCSYIYVADFGVIGRRGATHGDPVAWI